MLQTTYKCPKCGVYKTITEDLQSMSYNESLSPNSNYPAMSQFEWDNAPFNQADIPEKDFEVTCSQSLSRTATVTTSNYIPGASGVDYESDGDGGCCACGWQDPDDTSNTNWGAEYQSNGYYTPLQLIQMFSSFLGDELLKAEEDLKSDNQEISNLAKRQVGRLKHLIEECDSWQDDETEYIYDDQSLEYANN